MHAHGTGTLGMEGGEEEMPRGPRPCGGRTRVGVGGQGEHKGGTGEDGGGRNEGRGRQRAQEGETQGMWRDVEGEDAAGKDQRQEVH